MYWFKAAVKLVESAIYTPSKLVITNLKEETQNSEYAAGTFTLSSEIIKARVDGSTYFSNTARFRVAKITPTKIGQFVTFWQKGVTVLTSLMTMMRRQTCLLLAYLRTIMLKVIAAERKSR